MHSFDVAMKFSFDANLLPNPIQSVCTPTGDPVYLIRSPEISAKYKKKHLAFTVFICERHSKLIDTLISFAAFSSSKS